jgi:hypothetical protein
MWATPNRCPYGVSQDEDGNAQTNKVKHQRKDFYYQQLRGHAITFGFGIDFVHNLYG